MTSTPKGNRGPSAGPENRRALIDAARDVFSTEGLTAPLSLIARRAGVGQGSLYRHFPDRLSLAVAVFDDNVGRLESVLEHPETTLDDLLERVIDQAIVSTTLIDLIIANQHDPRALPLHDRVQGLLTRLVEREKAADRLGAHVAVDDVLLAISMLAGVLGRTPAADRADVARRAWALFHAAFVPY